ncbi:hypothetical protein GO755_26920 [Spirosoma sp. HMF4905]|uniref:Doubled CXXCH motif domain-containing protein n=1 Tax=Spirosoma arboris TaxID=2682092 RepID=A0A7K1SIQ4_9BACT|nr:hypothetical protein [Spirosoma arboris]
MAARKCRVCHRPHSRNKQQFLPRSEGEQCRILRPE